MLEPDPATDLLERWIEARFKALHSEIVALRILKQHDLASTNARLDDAKLALNAALISVTETTRRSDEAIEKRFESVNEFRETLREQAQSFIPRNEVTAVNERLSRDIEIIRDAQNNRVTRAEFEAAHQPLVEQLHRSSQPNWALYVSCGSVLALLLTGAFFVIQLKIDVSIAPMGLAIQQTITNALTRDRNLEQLSSKVETNLALEGVHSQAIATDSAEIAQIIQRLMPLETASQGFSEIANTSKIDRTQLNEKVRNLDDIINRSTRERDAKINDLHESLIRLDDKVDRNALIAKGASKP